MVTNLSSIINNDIPAEILVSLGVMLVLAIVAIVFGTLIKKADPLKKPSTLVLLTETAVGGIDNFVVGLMGEKFRKFAPYFLMVAMYLPVSFMTGLIGLPSPISCYVVPLSLALITFVMIHTVAVKHQHWGYFKRFVDPFAVFLPINLVTFWSNLLSLSFRLLGNALAGSIIMGMLYWATDAASNFLLGLVGLGGFNFIGPAIAPFLHMYFDLFGAFIQTLVFLSLSCIFIVNETE